MHIVIRHTKTYEYIVIRGRHGWNKHAAIHVATSPSRLAVCDYLVKRKQYSSNTYLNYGASPFMANIVLEQLLCSNGKKYYMEESKPSIQHLFFSHCKPFQQQANMVIVNSPIFTIKCRISDIVLHTFNVVNVKDKDTRREVTQQSVHNGHNGKTLKAYLVTIYVGKI